jgi:acyl-CoA thioester hydrolase
VSANVVVVRDRVWWSDVDKMGVMYFGRYIRFAEMAETEFFRSLGLSYDDIHAKFHIWLARIHVEIDYRRPAKLDDELICRAELAKLSGTSLHFRFPVERGADGQRLADIGLVVGCLDASTLKIARLPAPLRDLLVGRLAPAAPNGAPTASPGSAQPASPGSAQPASSGRALTASPNGAALSPPSGTSADGPE